MRRILSRIENTPSSENMGVVTHGTHGKKRSAANRGFCVDYVETTCVYQLTQTLCLNNQPQNVIMTS